VTGRRAVLLDVDGTLVDSNYLHIDAWQRAFAEVGRPVPAWRVHRALGMDSTLLLAELAGDDADELGDRLSELHLEHYLAQQDRLRPVEGALDTLAAFADDGLVVVLATSAPEPELAVLRRVLDAEDRLDIVTSADDVDAAKPDPGIVQVALDRAGVDAGDAVFVGDSRWDAVAAVRAGVRMVGVRSGGIGADELRGAGAAAVVDDVGALVDSGSGAARIRSVLWTGDD